MATPTQDGGGVKNASRPIFEDIIDLCDYCVKLTEAIVTDIKPRIDATAVDGFYERQKFESRKLEYTNLNPQDEGLQTCKLCKSIWKDFRKHATTHEIRTLLDYKGANSITRIYSCTGVSPERICVASIGGCEFAIWADRDSPASATLSDLPPVLGPYVDQVCNLVQRWRHDCHAHNKCVPQSDSPLPTRVLVLSGTDRRPSVQLMESKGRRGRYLALSHCWGAPEKRPLRTTSETYQMHQKGILFSDLPRTFQDIVELAQGIDVTYIWIDSLCIIQDNHEDWKAEAAKMGDVYSNATLVVAASGAKDSSEGLFIGERPYCSFLRLPYTTAGQSKGTFNMMYRPKVLVNDPKDIPLEKRAWTLQEHILAQRIVSFMPDGIDWICNSINVHETGLSQYQNCSPADWLRLLTDYTNRYLTFASDRLEAIRGITPTYQESLHSGCYPRVHRSVQKLPQDEYVAEYGVWKHHLADQLLWFTDEPCAEVGQLSYIPSWSWAATGFAKYWAGLCDKEMSSRLELTPVGHLEISGHLSTVQPTPVARYERDELLERDKRLEILRKACRPGLKRGFGSTCVCLGQDKGDRHGQTILGLAQFDGKLTTEYSHAWFVGERLKYHYREEKRDSSDKTRWIVNAIEFEMYMVLLLKKVSEKEFRRVGFAALFHEAYEAFQVELQEFEIV